MLMCDIQKHGGGITNHWSLLTTHVVLPREMGAEAVDLDRIIKDWREHRVDAWKDGMDLDELLMEYGWHVDELGRVLAPRNASVKVVTIDWVERCVKSGRMRVTDRVIL